MLFFEQLLLVLGLSMDGFTASVCMGMSAGRRVWPIVCLISGFHMLMLAGGWCLGAGCPEQIAHLYPWAAAALLVCMGGNMMAHAGQEAEPSGRQAALSTAALALATSLDALTVGVAMALMGALLWQAVLLVAVVMGTLSLAGALLGYRVGRSRRRAARFAGGVILAMLGVKILLGCLGIPGA